MKEKSSISKKIFVVASAIGRTSILILGVHITAAIILSLFYTFDIIFKRITTAYPFFILIVKYENGLKADILPLFYFIDNYFKIFIIFSVLIIFFAVIKLFSMDENPFKLIKENIFTKNLSFSHIFLIIFALETMYSIIITLLGITPVIPKLPHPIIVMVIAPVEEEIAARLVLIGIPLIMIDLIKKKNISNIFKEITVGWGEFNKVSIFLIVMSSIIFAQVHVEYGWDIWKFLPAFIAGIGLGVVFVKYGFLLAVLLHFALNSLPYISEFSIMGYNFPLIIIFGYLYSISGFIFLLATLLKYRPKIT